MVNVNSDIDRYVHNDLMENVDVNVDVNVHVNVDNDDEKDIGGDWIVTLMEVCVLVVVECVPSFCCFHCDDIGK